ncbi:BQ2448_2263 [Microbotryum intermedium]|uniref:BQ2448_2263 protein n=1 Tax=Microbotryum intermedium TaxID=269621 RepID=A0A238FB60_9BASI|nr:BQ2448_2263 [Microbotryum intermedium]
MQPFQDWPQLRKLSFLWWLLNGAFSLSGVVMIIFSTVMRVQWSRRPGRFALRSLTLKMVYLDLALFLGSLTVAVALAGIFAYRRSAEKNHKKKHRGLITFNWSLVVIILLTMLTGSVIWIDTLQERAQLASLWLEQAISTQAYLQDQLQCCGYWNATPEGGFRAVAGFCGDPIKALEAMPCVGPVSRFADYMLNNIFTTDPYSPYQIYGFTAIQLSLLLISICLIKIRREEDRFRALEEKEGWGGAFV